MPVEAPVIFPVQVRFPVVPASAMVHKVLLPSLNTKEPVLPMEMAGAVLDKTKGDAPDKVIVFPVDAPLPVTVFKVEVSLTVTFVVPEKDMSVPAVSKAAMS